MATMPEDKNVSNNAIALVFARNAFYRRLHFLMLSALALSLIVIGILSWVFMFLWKNPTQPLYFATDTVGRLIQIVPIDKPHMSTEEVSAWVMEAVQNAYSLDYVNYRGQLQGLQKYFTNYGWVNFINGLKASNNLVAILGRKEVMIGQIVDQPKLLAQGILAGAYAWKFQMSLLVGFWLPPYDDKSKFYNPWEVTVVVQRQPILQGYKGLGIAQLIASQVTTPSTQTPEISGTPTG